MYKNKKILCIIPSRKGSKRIPFKNEKLLNGIPLFQYSVEIAKKSKYIDDILVSTDSQKILRAAHELGCINNNLRPSFLSSDKSRIIDTILYELKKLNKKYDTVVLLQPTSPYRTVELLDGSIEKFFQYNTSLITVVESKVQPIFLRSIKNGKLEKIVNSSSDVRSQDFEKIYKIVGNIYINNIEKLTKDTILNENEIPYIISDEFDIDIDTMDDFERAEIFMKGIK